ncbi:YchE family NAAT transporter [Candidatus Methylomicrobium oryzae]|jgi:multiple antibiotic resistance protein|uniref:YchE family NAAT transporter n=1 Tax=Candidatus Methylomicrobium oryzae TaxID=2802053 RepID=UPI001920547D|nr:YchE family NAAT transporter [Methylomicrobium sp. RS1]MBL1264460.1 YchE family NAAT transporter [Methylomicrobium sp. RS1]
MLDYSDYIKIFIALLAVVDPIGVMPIIAGLAARGDRNELNSIAGTAALAVAAILLAALFIGEDLLHFFGISINSFKISGGILLMLMALSMLQAKTSETVHNRQEAEALENHRSLAIVPVSMPLLAGPGAISAVILYAQMGNSIEHYLLISLDILAVVLILWAVIRFIPWLTRHLGQTGVNVFTRLMGLILSALAIEFMASGLKGLFPVLSTHL